MQLNKDQKIVFFDGVCDLCNRTVNFLIRRDKSGNLRYSPLQGETAKELIPEHGQELATLVFYEDGQICTKSTAALKALSSVGGFWTMASIFLVIPKFIRDAVYNLVAKYRYKWFGKHDVCRVASPDERLLFLD